MRWKREFGETLNAIREKVDDNTHGLGASRRGQVHEHQEILGAVATATTDLQATRQELLEQQGRLISGLAESRTDIQFMLTELAQGLQGSAPAHSADPPWGPAPMGGAAFSDPGASGARDDGLGGRDSATPDSGDEGVSMGGIGQRPDHAPNLERAAGSSGGGGSDSAGAGDSALKQAIEAAYRGDGPACPPPPPPPPSAPEAAPGGDGGRSADPRVVHGMRLMRAAGLSSAELVCHHDMWDFLAGMASGHPHFRTPPAVDAIRREQVRTFLSGRSLIALLIVLWDSRENATVLDADWALAATAYDRITHALDAVSPRPGQRTVRISLEDGICPGPDDEAAAAAEEAAPPAEAAEAENATAGVCGPAGGAERETAQAEYEAETLRAVTAEARKAAAEAELHAVTMEDAARLTPRERAVRKIARMIHARGGAPESVTLHEISEAQSVSTTTASQRRRDAAELLAGGYHPGDAPPSASAA